MDSRETALTAPISKIKLNLYKLNKEKKKPANKLKVEHFKQQPDFFGKKHF